MSKEDILKGLSEKLKEVAPLVTAQDRRDACKDLNCDTATISRYLNAGGRKIDFAEALLIFFNKKIESRKSLIEA